MVEQIHELHAADKVYVSCGGTLRLMADQFEQSEEIDVVERVFRVVHHKRQKHRCDCQACIDTALGPPKLLTGGRYSVGFAVEVASDKYSMHKPLTRQCQEMAHQGLVVDSQTLWDQISALAKHLQNAYDSLRIRVLGRPVVGADEGSPARPQGRESPAGSFGWGSVAGAGRGKQGVVGMVGVQ